MIESHKSFGNGLLAFLDAKNCFDEFLPINSFINYSDMNDLSYKLNKYKKDSKERIKIAKKGKNFYLKHLNSTIVADYILSKLFDFKSKNNFVWEK